MSIATITFKDSPEGLVDVRIDFGDGGANEESGAHHSAMMAVTLLTRANSIGASVEDEGWDD